MMPYHTNTRRVFDRWERAVEVANAYGMQTALKHRVRRAGGVWRVEATDRSIVHTVAGRRARVGRLPGESFAQRRRRSP